MTSTIGDRRTGTAGLVAVVGPTAAGKSELAIELALRLGGEIVNADSMQLYRGMDVGTAKLGPRERRGVPHHLLDIWDVTETASVAVVDRADGAVTSSRGGCAQPTTTARASASTPPE